MSIVLRVIAQIADIASEKKNQQKKKNKTKQNRTKNERKEKKIGLTR